RYLHLDLPLALDAATELLQAFGESRRRVLGPARDWTQPPDEGAHLELPVLQLVLHFLEPLASLVGTTIEQPPCGEELQRAAGGGLEQAVMDVARHAKPFVDGSGQPQTAQEVDAVEPRDSEPGNHVAKNQIVQPHRRLVEREEAATNQFAVETP